MKSLFIIASLLIGQTALAQKIESRGRAFNPDIGINALFLAQESTVDKSSDGFQIQELEMQFSADIDSYFTGAALFALEKDATTGEFGIEPEEAYLETTDLPIVTVKFGKFKQAFGKENRLHAHAQPFVSGALLNETILGEEGLTENGVSAAALIPIDKWFSEVTLEYTQGDNDTLFNSPKKDNKVGLLHFKNLFDLSDNMTLEFGQSAAKGNNSGINESTLLGADLTLKWRPSKFKGVTWQTEYMSKDVQGTTVSKLAGISSFIKARIKERWHIRYRYDHVGLNKQRTADISRRHGILAGYSPSEFSLIRLQYDHSPSRVSKPENRVMLQVNISMGAHPAHAY